MKIKTPANIETSTEPQNSRQIIAEALECIKSNSISKAFDLLLPVSYYDETALMLLMRIIRWGYPVFQLTKKQINQLKDIANQGYGFGQFAYGRYLQLVNPKSESLEQAEELFLKAAENGAPDAKACLALMYRDGRLGFVDREEAKRLLEEAYENYSYKAYSVKTRDIIYGKNGWKANPEVIVNTQLKVLIDKNGEKKKDPLEVEPEMYDLLGRAYYELGEREKAADAFMTAIEMGLCESLLQLIFATCLDDDGNIIDTETYNHYVEVGCDRNVAICFAFRADMKQETYDTLNEAEKAEATQKIKKDLETSYNLGEYLAAWMLGNNYYYGKLGFEENNGWAWTWYARAALYGCPEGYEMLAEMIQNGHCPDQDLSEEFLEDCQLNALRLGNDDMLNTVCEAYCHGKLTTHAAEIEKYYMPLYEQFDDDDDYPDDDGRYDAWA